MKPSPSNTPCGAHTPGPWEVWRDLNDNSVNVSSTRETGSRFVCLVGRIEAKSEAAVINADARLIAAAPDLLAFAEHCVARFAHGPNANPNDGLLHDGRALLQKVKP